MTGIRYVAIGASLKSTESGSDGHAIKQLGRSYCRHCLSAFFGDVCGETCAICKEEQSQIGKLVG